MRCTKEGKGEASEKVQRCLGNSKHFMSRSSKNEATEPGWARPQGPCGLSEALRALSQRGWEPLKLGAAVNKGHGAQLLCLLALWPGVNCLATGYLSLKGVLRIQ